MTAEDLRRMAREDPQSLLRPLTQALIEAREVAIRLAEDLTEAERYDALEALQQQHEWLADEYLFAKEPAYLQVRVNDNQEGMR